MSVIGRGNSALGHSNKSHRGAVIGLYPRLPAKRWKPGLQRIIDCAKCQRPKAAAVIMSIRRRGDRERTPVDKLQGFDRGNLAVLEMNSGRPGGRGPPRRGKYGADLNGSSGCGHKRLSNYD